MNISLIGRGEMLMGIAQNILAAGHRINLIITAKESPEHTITAKDLEEFAQKAGATFLYAPILDSPEIYDAINNIVARDIALSVNYSSIITQNIIDLFTHGILNAHGGDLPRYKGNACQAWAIINGEKQIGLCVHKMIGDAVDEGKIITREYLPIDINTKIGAVYDWMNNRIPPLMLKAIEALGKDADYFLENTQTQTGKKPLRCYPRTPEDGRIDWRKTNLEILRLINASSQPFIGAYCTYDGKTLYILDAELCEDEEDYLAIPGQVSKIDVQFVDIICGNGKLTLKEIEYEGVKSTQPSKVITSMRKRLK